MADDEGVLGNLPKSRPGRRSAKRDAGAGRPSKAAEKAATRAEAAGESAAQPPRTPKGSRAASSKASHPRRTAATKGGSRDRVEVRAAYQPKVQREPMQPSGDPLSAAVRTAAGIAVGGVRVAGAVTQELLRRLPRP